MMTGRPPNLVPMYGCRPYWPGSPCPHTGPIPRGSRMYCEICGRSGLDHLAYFRPSPTDPKPDPRPAPRATPPPTLTTPTIDREAKLTRRVLRLLRFGPPRSRPQEVRKVG